MFELLDSTAADAGTAALPSSDSRVCAKIL